jgi:hypothetical protein
MSCAVVFIRLTTDKQTLFVGDDVTDLMYFRSTRYGLDGPGIQSWWRRDFPHPSRQALGAQLAFYTMVTGSFQGVKRPGRGVAKSGFNEYPPEVQPVTDLPKDSIP